MEQKKRKHEPEPPRITFITPNRTFERLFKDTSLEATKTSVRKKLNLPETERVDLAQVRDGKNIDLEDDDDFEAFRAYAVTVETVEVRVVLSDSAAIQPAVKDFSKPVAAPEKLTDSSEEPETRPKKKKKKHDTSQDGTIESRSASASELPREKVTAKGASTSKSKATNGVVPKPSEVSGSNAEAKGKSKKSKNNRDFVTRAPADSTDTFATDKTEIQERDKKKTNKKKAKDVSPAAYGKDPAQATNVTHNEEASKSELKGTAKESKSPEKHTVKFVEPNAVRAEMPHKEKKAPKNKTKIPSDSADPLASSSSSLFPIPHGASVEQEIEKMKDATQVWSPAPDVAVAPPKPTTKKEQKSKAKVIDDKASKEKNDVDITPVPSTSKPPKTSKKPIQSSADKEQQKTEKKLKKNTAKESSDAATAKIINQTSLSSSNATPAAESSRTESSPEMNNAKSASGPLEPKEATSLRKKSKKRKLVESTSDSIVSDAPNANVSGAGPEKVAKKRKIQSQADQFQPVTKFQTERTGVGQVIAIAVNAEPSTSDNNSPTPAGVTAISDDDFDQKQAVNSLIDELLTSDRTSEQILANYAPYDAKERARLRRLSSRFSRSAESPHPLRSMEPQSTQESATSFTTGDFINSSQATFRFENDKMEEAQEELVPPESTVPDETIVDAEIGDTQETATNTPSIDEPTAPSNEDSSDADNGTVESMVVNEAPSSRESEGPSDTLEHEAPSPSKGSSVPPGSVISEVVVQTRDEGSSSEEEDSDDDIVKSSGFIVPAVSQSQQANALDGLDLMGILHGSQRRLTVRDIPSEDEQEESNEDERLSSAVDEEDEEEVDRHSSQRTPRVSNLKRVSVSPSVGEDNEEDEDEIMLDQIPPSNLEKYISGGKHVEKGNEAGPEPHATISPGENSEALPLLKDVNDLGASVVDERLGDRAVSDAIAEDNALFRRALDGEDKDESSEKGTSTTAAPRESDIPMVDEMENEFSDVGQVREDAGGTPELQADEVPGGKDVTTSVDLHQSDELVGEYQEQIQGASEGTGTGTGFEVEESRCRTPSMRRVSSPPRQPSAIVGTPSTVKRMRNRHGQIGPVESKLSPGHDPLTIAKVVDIDLDVQASNDTPQSNERGSDSQSTPRPVKPKTVQDLEIVKPNVRSLRGRSIASEENKTEGTGRRLRSRASIAPSAEGLPKRVTRSQSKKIGSSQEPVPLPEEDIVQTEERPEKRTESRSGTARPHGNHEELSQNSDENDLHSVDPFAGPKGTQILVRGTSPAASSITEDSRDDENDAAIPFPSSRPSASSLTNILQMVNSQGGNNIFHSSSQLSHRPSSTFMLTPVKDFGVTKVVANGEEEQVDEDDDDDDDEDEEEEENENDSVPREKRAGVNLTRRRKRSMAAFF